MKISVLAKTHQLTKAKMKMADRASAHLMADFGMEMRAGGVRVAEVAVGWVWTAFGNKRSPLKKMGQRI